MHTEPHHWVNWAMYGGGLLLHVMLVANLAVHSKLNSVESFSRYFKARWAPIVSRTFLCICLFQLVWDNPALFDIDRFMHTPGSQWALAGVLGWFSDSLFDKLLTLVPYFRKELPVIPPAGESGPQIPKET